MISVITRSSSQGPHTGIQKSDRHFPRLSLRRNFSWTLIGRAVYVSSQWLILIILAKLTTPEVVGQLGLGLAITAPVFMFTGLHLRSVQATDAGNEYLFGHYLSLRIATTLLALLFIAILSLVAGYSWHVRLVIITIGVEKAVESISDIIYGLELQHERMDLMAKSQILKGPFAVLAMGLGVYVGNSLLWGIVGWAVARAMILFSYDLRNTILILRPSLSEPGTALRTNPHWLELIRPIWSWKTLGRLTWLTLPLGFTVMINSLNLNIPRYFIEYYLGSRDLGIFVALSYIMVGGNTVISALAITASPRLAKHYVAKNISAFRRILFKVLGLVGALGVLGIILTLTFGREVLTILYRPEYAAQVQVFIWLAVGAALGYMATFLRFAMTAARYLRVQLPLYILANLTMAVACYYLIPRFGLLGAALSIIVSMLVMFIGNGSVIGYILLTAAPSEKIEPSLGIT